MWSALKAFFKHCWVQFVRLSSELHPQWCESQAVTCYEADLARYTLCVSGLCLADLEGTEWAGLWRMRLCLNVSAFFGGGTSSLA